MLAILFVAPDNLQQHGKPPGKWQGLQVLLAVLAWRNPKAGLESG